MIDFSNGEEAHFVIVDGGTAIDPTEEDVISALGMPDRTIASENAVILVYDDDISKWRPNK